MGRRNRAWLLLILVALITPAHGKHGKDLSVTFINPRSSQNDFWGTVTAFMIAAADDLGIKLTVLNAHQNRYRHIEFVREMAASDDRPDFLITMYLRNSTDKVLKIADQAGIKTFMINTGVPEEDRSEVGYPRQKLRHWIGVMHPDDVQAGHDLAIALVRKARQLGLDKTAPLQVVGITGNHQSPATMDRNAGLNQALSETGVALDQLIFALWRYDLAAMQSKRLIKRYPQARIYWSASDLMSLAVINSLRAAGKVPGRDVVTGGVDWSPEGLEAIQSGAMSASMGGHFMEGGWIMVMLYDYAHGVDFADVEGVSMKSKMSLIDASNVDNFIRCFSDRDWDRIDFRQFSRFLHPEIKQYNFSLQEVFRQLENDCPLSSAVK